jgi:GNAT superfamily N-acetyltransferase
VDSSRAGRRGTDGYPLIPLRDLADQVACGVPVTDGLSLASVILLGTMLDNLHVLSSQKGKGIGRKLVRDIASWCDRDYPNKGLYLWVFE